MTKPFPTTFANKACHVDDPASTYQHGRVADIACGGYGRYVTLQLLASDEGAGILRVGQFQVWHLRTCNTIHRRWHLRTCNTTHRRWHLRTCDTK